MTTTVQFPRTVGWCAYCGHEGKVSHLGNIAWHKTRRVSYTGVYIADERCPGSNQPGGSKP